MRYRFAPILILAIVLTAVIAGAANATPSQTTECSVCHSGTATGTVTATPSTSSPAAGASYSVAINIGLTASGKTGYRIAQTNAAGTTTTWTPVYSGTASQTSWAATMTAPATPGTYYYKAWTREGPEQLLRHGRRPPPGTAITVTARRLRPLRLPHSDAPRPTAHSDRPLPTPLRRPSPALARPRSGPVGTTLVISGTNLGSSGAVSIGGITAATSAWSATSITCTVPAGLIVGAKNVVVTPTGARGV